MRATKIVFGALLLVLLASTGAVAYLPVYLEDHRDLIEAGATLALGRPVEIEGSLTLAWSPLPSIAVQGLRIPNPDWARGTQLMRAGRVEVQLELGALLERRIRILRLLVRKADFDLEAALAYRDTPLSVSATSGREGETQGASWPFKIRTKTADATLEATGSRPPLDWYSRRRSAEPR